MKTHWTLMPGLLALGACSTLPPSTEPRDSGAAFTLRAPERLIASEAAPARFQVSVTGATTPVRLSLEGAPAGVTTRFDPPETTGTSLVTVTVAPGTSAMTAGLTLRATDADAEQKQPVRLDVVGAPKLPTRAPAISVTLDRLF